MPKITFTGVDHKFLNIAFRFLGIFMLACFLCLMPSTRTYAQKQTAPAVTSTYKHYTDNSSVEKMEENDSALEQMKKEQKDLNQTYKEKILLYKNSSATLTEAQNQKLQQLNREIKQKNKQLKRNLSELANKKKKYLEMDPASPNAKRCRKNIICLQNDTIKRMKKINRLFKRQIAVLDNV